MVRDLGPDRSRRLRRADVHAPVDGHRVDRHEFDVANVCSLTGSQGPDGVERNLRLAGGRGPHQGDVHGLSRRRLG